MEPRTLNLELGLRGIMNKNRHSLMLIAVLLFGLGSAAAQVKLAEISGAPGAFNTSSSVVFKKSGNTGFISNPVTGAILEFRPTTGEILGSFQAAPGVAALGLAPDDRMLIALNVATQRIQIIDTTTMTLRREAGYPKSGFTALNNIAFSKDGVKFLIADPANDQVTVFNTSDGSVDRYIKVGINPNILTASPDNSHVAVICSGRDPEDVPQLFEIDTFILWFDDAHSITENKVQPFNNLQYSADSKYLFGGSYDDNRLMVYNTQTFFLASRLNSGDGPGRVSISPDGRLLAVPNIKSKDVGIYLVPDMTLLKKVAIPGLDFTSDSVLAFSPDSHTLFIPSRATSEILAFDVDNLQISRRIPTGAGSTMLKMSLEGVVLSSVETAANLLSLIALKPFPLYIPHLTQTATDYAGLAFANFGGESANLSLIARNNSGEIIAGSSNPRLLTVPPGQQIAMTVGQVFGFDPAAHVDGYTEVYTLGTAINALYMTGDNAQTHLEGLTADSATSKLIGFGRITDGIMEFGVPTSTEIIMLNPGEADANLTLRLFARTLDGPGSMVAYTSMKLAAHNCYHSRVSNMIAPGFFPMENAYLEVTSDVPIKGLANVKIGSSFALIPAGLRGIEETSFFAAQFASGGAGVLGTPIFSNLSYTNSSQTPITITTQVVDEFGRLVPPKAKPNVRRLQPYESISGGANELFGWPDPLTDPALYQGTLQINVDQKGLIVDLLYGDARNGKYLTPVNLHAQSGRVFGIGHLAEGLFGNPAKGLYTGLAIYNPNQGFSNVTVQAFSPKGESLGRTDFMLEKASRVSKTLGQFIPSIKQQNGGTVRITSDIPLLLFGVFGSALDEFLVAVPPVILGP